MIQYGTVLVNNHANLAYRKEPSCLASAANTNSIVIQSSYCVEYQIQSDYAYQLRAAS